MCVCTVNIFFVLIKEIVLNGKKKEIILNGKKTIMDEIASVSDLMSLHTTYILPFAVTEKCPRD